MVPNRSAVTNFLYCSGSSPVALSLAPSIPNRRTHFPLLFKMVGYLAGSDGWTDVVPYKFAKAIVNGLPYPPHPAPQPHLDPQTAKVPVVIEVEALKTIPFADIPMRSRRDRKRWTRQSGSIVLKDGTRATISYGTYGDYGIEY